MDVLLAAFTYTPQQRWGPVSPHGIGTALGFFLGAWLMAKRAEPRGIPRSEVYNAVTWGAIGAIIGARGFYVIGHLSSYSSIADAVKVWEGGLTMFGGFIGGLVLGLGYLWRRKFDIPTAMDAAAPGFVVGVLIGRIGDIVIADHLGERTSAFFGYTIPNAPLAPGYGPPYYTPGVVVHHTALYDFIGALVLLGFLRWLEKRTPKTGSLFAAFSIWYGIQRFVVDFTRNRAIIESSYFGLSGSQWAGLAFAVFGGYLLIRMRGRVPVDAAAVPAVVGTTPDAPPAWATPPAPVPPAPSEQPTVPPPTAPPVPAPAPATPEPTAYEPAAPSVPASTPPPPVPPPPVPPPPVAPTPQPEPTAYEPPTPAPVPPPPVHEPPPVQRSTYEPPAPSPEGGPPEDPDVSGWEDEGGAIPEAEPPDGSKPEESPPDESPPDESPPAPPASSS